MSATYGELSRGKDCEEGHTHGKAKGAKRLMMTVSENIFAEEIVRELDVEAERS